MTKITCKCGKEVDSLTRSHTDRKFNIQRCHDCYDIEHGKEVVERALKKKKRYEGNIELQRLERKAKAEKLSEAFEGASINKDKRYSSSTALKNRKRRDIIERKREIVLIDEYHAI